MGNTTSATLPLFPNSNIIKKCIFLACEKFGKNNLIVLSLDWLQLFIFGFNQKSD